jgi:hypothetical protein
VALRGSGSADFGVAREGLDQPAFAEAEETGVMGMSGQADDEVILESQAEQAAGFMQAPG